MAVLDGITVLDVTQFLSGPFATQLLGDLGANVIKIEWGEGDSARKLPPYFVEDDSLYYLSINRNKRSVCINLKSEAGRAVFLRLVQRADVVIDNFRPGVMERLGLGEEILRGANPEIVLCSITGFGANGPLANRPAYDMVIQAASGGMSMTGEAGGRPVRAGVPLADLSAGLYGAIGILAELASRNRDKRPRKRIDVSMLDCQLAMLSYQAAYALFSGEEPGPQGRGHRSIPTYSSFRCRDGVEVLTCANTERMWRDMCSALDLAQLVEDPRFLTNSDRLEHAEALRQLLDERFASLDSGTALSRLEQGSVPCSRVNGVLEALRSEQAESREMVMELTHPSGTAYAIAGDPLKLSDRVPLRAPVLGEHTEEILREFGYTEAQLTELQALGAVWSGSALSGSKGGSGR